MTDFKAERVLEAMEGEWGDGDLCLFIGCTKCNAQFELNNQSVVVSIGMNVPFIEYVRYVQNSKCPKCRHE